MRTDHLGGSRGTRDGGGGGGSLGGSLGEKGSERRGGRLQRGDLVSHVGEVLLKSLDEESKVILEGEEEGGSDGDGTVTDSTTNNSDNLLGEEEVSVDNGVEEDGAPERTDEGKSGGVGEVVDEVVKLVVDLTHDSLKVLELSNSVTNGLGEEVERSVNTLENGLDHVSNVVDSGDDLRLGLLGSRSGGSSDGRGQSGGDSDRSDGDHCEGGEVVGRDGAEWLEEFYTRGSPAVFIRSSRSITTSPRKSDGEAPYGNCFS